MSKNEQILFCHPANTDKVHQLNASEILVDNEICCPPTDACLWSSHPRVYLKLNEEGNVRCPYCSTLYYLGEKS